MAGLMGSGGGNAKEILVYNMFYGNFMAYIANFMGEQGTLVLTHDNLTGKYIRTTSYSQYGGINVYAAKSGYFLAAISAVGYGKDVFSNATKKWYEKGALIESGAPNQNYVYIFVKAL